MDTYGEVGLFKVFEMRCNPPKVGTLFLDGKKKLNTNLNVKVDLWGFRIAG